MDKSALGLTIENDRLIIKCVDESGQRVKVDLTEEIERIASEKVQEHMAKYHGHQL